MEQVYIVLIFISAANSWHVTMSISSKAKKVKPKGTVRELKIVHTVNRHGADIITTEVVEIPQRSSQNTPSTSHRISSSSPTKRPKTVDFDVEPIPCDLEAEDSSKKRQTLVFSFPLTENNVWFCSEPKWLSETVLGPREDILESSSQLWNAS